VSTEVIRAEYGTPAQRGRITEVVEDGPHGTYKRKVIRDAQGRIIGTEGESLAEAVAERTDQLAGRVERLEAEPVPDVAEVAAATTAAVEGAEGRIVGRVDTLGDGLAERLDRLEGWVAVEGTGLQVNAEALGLVTQRYGLPWPIEVRFYAPDEQRALRRAWLCSNKDEDGYEIGVYAGLGVERTANAIAHEIGHLVQVRRIGVDYIAVYEECKDELEREADELAESIIADFEFVRNCN